MSLTLDLEPYERCGPLTGGLPAGRVGMALGLPVTAFRKSPQDGRDALDADGRLHVFFDEAGGCTGLEIFTGMDVTVTMAGETLLLPDGAVFIETLVRLGQHWEIDDYGIHAPMLGVATFHPAFDWDGGERGIDALYVSLDPAFVP